MVNETFVERSSSRGTETMTDHVISFAAHNRVGADYYS
jgi:hypothetical protein